MNISTVSRSSKSFKICMVAGDNENTLSSVRSIRPLISLPNHPINILKTIKPATPS